ncbi:unnamed protein product [Cunninghamella echinulata]
MVKVPNFTSSQLVWFDLKTKPKELRLDTLSCGQSFRWRFIMISAQSVFFGVPKKQAEDKQVVQRLDKTLRDYFQLDFLSLETCYEDWGQKDKNFKKKSIHFQGIRMLRQDPWENLICFICSSNNNITRISQMVHKLCTNFGSKIATLDKVDYYGFPTLKSLANEKMEVKLRELGFGYRAKYIAKTAQIILKEHPNEQEEWVKSLRQLPYEETKEILMTLPGVGPKVADCICLMSMDHSQAIPVDTHVWQIANKDYGFKKQQTKTLNKTLYNDIGNHFRSLFGDYSGWAHSVLFSAELSSFKHKLEVEEKDDDDDDGNSRSKKQKKQ